MDIGACPPLAGSPPSTVWPKKPIPDLSPSSLAPLPSSRAAGPAFSPFESLRATLSLPNGSPHRANPHSALGGSTFAHRPERESKDTRHSAPGTPLTPLI